MKIATKNIVLCGLLTAAATILGGALSMKFFLGGVYSLKMSFAIVPCILAGLTMGPIYGFIVGFLTDAATKFVFPADSTTYMPLFSVAMGCMGMMPALLAPLFGKLLRRNRDSMVALLPSIAISQVLFSTMANTALIAWLSHISFWMLLPNRLIALVLIPVHAFLCALLMRVYKKTNNSIR